MGNIDVLIDPWKRVDGADWRIDGARDSFFRGDTIGAFGGVEMNFRDVLRRAGWGVRRGKVEARKQAVFPVRESGEGYGGCRGARPDFLLNGGGRFCSSIEPGVGGRLEDAEVANHRGWGGLHEMEVELGGVCFDAEARGLGDCEGDVATDDGHEDCSQQGKEMGVRHQMRFGLLGFLRIELSPCKAGRYKYGLSKKSAIFG